MNKKDFFLKAVSVGLAYQEMNAKESHTGQPGFKHSGNADTLGEHRFFTSDTLHPNLHFLLLAIICYMLLLAIICYCSSP